MDPIRTEVSRALRQIVPGASGSDQPTRPVERIERADRVQISDAGRRLAEQLGSAPAGEPLSEARIDEIRLRIRAGEYDRLDVIDSVARRMLERGDV